MEEIILNSDNFDNEVSESEKIILVDFYAEWCGPCQMLTPIIDGVRSKYLDKVKVCKVNVDNNSDLALKYSVVSIPTLLFFKNGKIVSSSVGFLSEEELINIIEGLL